MRQPAPGEKRTTGCGAGRGERGKNNLCQQQRQRKGRKRTGKKKSRAEQCSNGAGENARASERETHQWSESTPIVSQCKRTSKQGRERENESAQGAGTSEQAKDQTQGRKGKRKKTARTHAERGERRERKRKERNQRRRRGKQTNPGTDKPPLKDRRGQQQLARASLRSFFSC